MAKIIKHYYLDERDPGNMEIMIDITDGAEGLRAYSFDMENINELISDRLTLNTSIMVLMIDEKDENGKIEVDVKVSRNGLKALTKQDISKWDKCILITEDKDNMNSEFIEYLYDSINNEIKKSEVFKLFNSDNKRELSNLEYTEQLMMKNKVKNVKFLLDLKLNNTTNSNNYQKESDIDKRSHEFNMFDKQIEDSRDELNNVREQLRVSRNELGALRKQTKIAKHSLEQAGRDTQKLAGELESKLAEADQLDEALNDKLAYVEMADEDVKIINKQKSELEDEVSKLNKKLEGMKIDVANKISLLGEPYRPKSKKYGNTTIYKIDGKFKLYRGSIVRKHNRSGFMSTEGDVHFDSLPEMIDFITDGRNDGIWERVPY